MSVKYSDIRNTIQTGDLLAWDIKKIGSVSDLVLKAYQKIFKANYSHVGVAVILGGRVFVVEATLPVVRLYPLSRKPDFYIVPCSIETKNTYIEYLFDKLGDAYSLFDLIKACFGISGVNSEFYCSELAGGFYKYIGLLDNEDDGKLPQTLVDSVVKATGKDPVFVTIDGGNI